ncbi:hypothetical protein MHB54_05810 [Paenibacillus sp. FSL M7-0802]|uniref:hypothetical protein n=1 Tax=Paenibacillus TaxID=44249 RepID=UPI0003D2CE16|nr:hypothetical protein [Paenibacillus polymyxa]AHC19037.1 hypothetical protein X809_07290 [Paenibacillus polymyxa CR1]
MEYTNNNMYEQTTEDSDSVDFIQIISKIGKVVKENKEFKRENLHLISQNRQLAARNQLLEMQMIEYISHAQELEQRLEAQNEYALGLNHYNRTDHKKLSYFNNSGYTYLFNCFEE